MLVKYLFICFLIFSSLLLISCDDQNDSIIKWKDNNEKKLFNGTSRLKGTVYFKNVYTNTLDSARTATLTLSKGVERESEYKITLVDGTFDIKYLQDGTYTLDLRYDHRPTNSTQTTVYKLNYNITLSKGQVIDNLDLTLSIEPTTLDTPTLRIIVKDVNGALVSNANVCLYADINLITKNRTTCNGSTRSAVTNQQGVVLFDNLENIKYHISTYKVIGSDTLSNRATYLQPTKPLKANELNDTAVTIQASNPTTLSIMVKDAAGALIPNAQVCLYSDPVLLRKYRNTCDGSLKSDTTNLQGVVSFTDIQSIPYYVATFVVVGNDTLSNKENDLTTVGPILPNQSTSINVIVKPSVSLPALKIIVKDEEGALIPNANVCLYSSLELINKNSKTCVGSLRNDVTNQQGVVQFNDLQTLKYYISAYSIHGTDTLNNEESFSVPVGPLLQNSLNQTLIIINQ